MLKNSPHRSDSKAHIDIKDHQRRVFIGAAPVYEERGYSEQVEREARARAPRHQPVDLLVLVFRVERVEARDAAAGDA